MAELTNAQKTVNVAGEIVALRSGGQNMVVAGVREDSSGKTVLCVWMRPDGVVMELGFWPHVLVVIAAADREFTPADQAAAQAEWVANHPVNRTNWLGQKV